MFLEGFQSFSYVSTNYRNHNILDVVHRLMADSGNYSIDIILINAVNGKGDGGVS